MSLARFQRTSSCAMLQNTTEQLNVGMWIQGMSFEELEQDISCSLRFSSYLVRELQLKETVVFVHINNVDNSCGDTYGCQCRLSTGVFQTSTCASAFAQKHGLETKPLANGEGFMCFDTHTDLEKIASIVGLAAKA